MSFDSKRPYNDLHPLLPSVEIKTLVGLGLLEEVKAGRENLYIYPALLILLSDRSTP
ncbi:hypothetical protein AB4Z52_28830 [Rhizobium sp. 2YAF20]|uniref:hypothetical protein n=1 Tax=Rhizobium sp. 2YAF20 TaxID=3233027 RepID=UPI003F94FE39